MKSANDKSSITSASLRFMSGNLDPIEVTKLLDTAPTQSYKEGDVYTVGKYHKTQIRRFGLWLLRTDKLVDSTDMSKHVEFISDILTHDIRYFWNDEQFNNINRWIRDHKVQLDVSLFWRGTSYASAPHISGEFQEAIKMIGGKIEQDFYSKKIDEGSQSQIFA